MAAIPSSSVPLNGHAVLLDIEGTVSPVAFVYDVMFPYIREHAASFLHNHWHAPAVQAAVALLGEDLAGPAADDWPGAGPQDQQQLRVVTAINQLMDRDAKLTGLKQMQGLIWKDGFDNGQLVAELFPDVLAHLKIWKAAGRRLFIYSSGSVGAQRLFFGHTTAGDLLGLFEGHFDTTVGSKLQAASYTAIADRIGLQAAAICFISDVTAELDAAAAAGMSTILRVASPTESLSHPAVTSFQSICVSTDGTCGG